MRTYSIKEYALGRLNFLPYAMYDAFPSVLLGRVVVLASRLGVFNALSSQPMTPEEISAKLKLNIEGTKHVLRVLESSGYVKKRMGKFQLTSQSKKWLVSSSPNYIGNFLGYIGLLHDHWTRLEETIRAGEPPVTYVESFDEKEWEIYTLGMMDLAQFMIPCVLPKIKLKRNQGRLLDLGGSHGMYSIELCRRHSQLHATVADFPQPLAVAKKIVRLHSMEERVTLMPVDLAELKLDHDAYDVVLAFNIVHGFRQEANQEIFTAISSTLKRNGHLYILEQLVDDRSSGLNRLLPAVVGLNLMNEIGGSAYSFDDIKRWCDLAGLSNIRLHRVHLPGVSLVSASKQ